MIPFASEEERLAQFPIAAAQIFTGHAGVTALPRRVADAMCGYVTRSCEQHQEFGTVLQDIASARVSCAALVDAQPDEIALLGPTSLGLSIFANGLEWKAGDELVCYLDDYPANVYPWLNLRRLGVEVKFVKPDHLGRITPELVEAALTSRTRMVALASCHFLTGWRIDIDTIGKMLQARGVLFSLDAIQTIGAFHTSTRYVDFLSADAHKWMLGPLAIGIVYVAKRNFPICHPTLLGAWNVHSPQFISQDRITFPETAQRYEPGAHNIAGMYGMRAAVDMFLEIGMEQISERILAVRDHLHQQLEALGFETISPGRNEPMRCGILTVRHPGKETARFFRALEEAKITASLRNTRDGGSWLRFSPHFYNTRAEMDRIVEVLGDALKS
ncbi:MAG TPA: aminotransferase class V-fold PLP-dependent enzyme [Chthoniobacterales bacterium]|nr:aminotransferase class V-fold PLP-dependent enzyme [Chthoniobacterales bacterium]